MLSLCTNCYFKTNWHYPTNSWTHCSVVWWWAVSEGGIEQHRSVTRLHLQGSTTCSGDQNGHQRLHGHRLRMTKPNEDRALIRIINKTDFSHHQESRDDQSNWTSCFCPHSPKTFGGSWVSLKMSNQLHQTDWWSSPRMPCMGTQALQLEPLALMIFADDSRFSLYHCDDRARILQRLGERLVDCCIKKNRCKCRPPPPPPWYGLLSMYQANRGW